MDASERFAAELRRLRLDRQMSYRALAKAALRSSSYIEDLEKGRKTSPHRDVVHNLDEALGADGSLITILYPPMVNDVESEIEAIELARRVTATDVSPETLDRLELASDRMAMAYATTPPDLLLPRVRGHLDYVVKLLDARKTLDQQRRLIVIGGWLALLRATLHIDLRQACAADAYLDSAAEMARQATHREIAAWTLETRAWDALTAGDYRATLDLSQHAQAIAPAGSSAYLQATAQEGRAWARLGDRAKTRAVLDRVERLAGNRPAPDHPEHHYQYDPAKAHSYAATTLAWAGDPAAEGVARAVIVELEAEAVARPRRIASARLDLSLALLAADKPDEAAAEAGLAINSGRIVSSNWWRAAEVVAGVSRSGVPEARDLVEQARVFRPAIEGVR